MGLILFLDDMQRIVPEYGFREGIHSSTAINFVKMLYFFTGS